MEDVDYSLYHDIPSSDSNQKKSIREDDQVLELVWQNGHVVANSQTINRKTAATLMNNVEKTDIQQKQQGGHVENPNSLMRDDETASWIKYLLYEDSPEKDACMEFSDKPKNNNMDAPTVDNRCRRFRVPMDSNNIVKETTRPPPPIPQINNSAGTSQEERQCSSTTTKVSTNSRRNQVHQSQTHLHSSLLGNVVLDEATKDGQPTFFHGRMQTSTLDMTATTATATDSSFRSGSSIEKSVRQNSRSQRSHKRKGRSVEESEYQSKESDYMSGNERKVTQISTSACKSRSVEVHNLSERRRRDRINEKMRALQDLIPHSNKKTDKASILDETITYLKSLQQQVQIMWIANGMVPAIFPNNVQRHISSSSMGMGMGIGMGQSCLPPALPGALQMPLPMYDRSMPWMNATIQTEAIAAQMQNVDVSSFSRIQPPHETSNLCYGSQHQRMPSIWNNQPSHGASPSIMAYWLIDLLACWLIGLLAYWLIPRGRLFLLRREQPKQRLG